VIQVVYLTFRHDEVEPTVHSAKIRIQLGLSWRVCIKYTLKQWQQQSKSMIKSNEA